MACTECGTTCQLVDSKCICEFTPLEGFTEEELSACYAAANTALIGLTGDCDLCEGFGTEGYKYTDTIQSAVFRGYYSYLIYSFWMRLYGAGKPGKEGFVTKESDDFSSFRVNTEKEVSAKLERINPILEMYKTQFLEAFKESFESCFEETCSTCGDDCTCKKVAKDGSSLSIFGYKNDKDFSTDDMAII